MTGRKHPLPAVLLLVILPVIIIVAGCIQPVTPSSTGQLGGTVTIGPLCPVEPCHTSEEQRVAAYSARHLVITSEGQSSRTYEVPFSPDGHYTIELPEGHYHVDIVKNGIDRGEGVPTTVTIKRGEMVTLDLSIDTGIR